MSSMGVATINVGPARTASTATTTTPTPDKRRDVAWIKASCADEIEDFASGFKLLINIARTLGALPIYKTGTGWQFGVLSRVFVYSVLVYLALMFPFVHVIELLLDKNATFSVSRGAFHRRVYNHMFIGLLANYVSVPITGWMDAPDLAKYINEWNDFQSLYRFTTGSRLFIKDTRRAQLALSVGSAAFIGACLHLFALRDLHYWERLPHLISLFFSASCGWYWMMTSNAIVGASQQLNAAFLTALRTSSAPRRQLHAYRRLWLALSRLTGNTSASFWRTAGLFTLAELYLIVLAVHGLFSSMLGMHLTVTSNVVYVMTSATTVSAFYVFCNRGYRITEQVKNGILETLQSINTPEYDCRTVRELNLFFQCIEANPPLLSLGGFVTVNRDLFKSCCATIFTYLVVIIQFELGLNLDADADAGADVARNASEVVASQQ